MASRSNGGSRGARGKGSSGGSRGKAQGYTLRGKNNRIDYVGITKDPARRASEHKADGKSGTMNVETRKMNRPAARKWEQNRLDTYRDNHGGKNPPQNRSRGGRKG